MPKDEDELFPDIMLSEETKKQKKKENFVRNCHRCHQIGQQEEKRGKFPPDFHKLAKKIFLNSFSQRREGCLKVFGMCYSSAVVIGLYSTV